MGTELLLFPEDGQSVKTPVTARRLRPPRVPSGQGRAREIADFRERWGGADAEARFSSYCQELFTGYNARYFSDVLIPVQIGIGDGYQTLDEVGYQYYGRYLRGRGRASKEGAQGAIELDYSLAVRPRKLRLVLLHEMLHHYEHGRRRDPSRVCKELEEPIDEPPYLGAAMELAFLLGYDRDVRRWIAIELGLPCGPDDDDRIRFYLRGHSHRFIVAAYNLARIDHRANRWYYV